MRRITASECRFPERLSADVEVEEVDLDLEPVHLSGERLTEARAEAVAGEVLSHSRSGDGSRHTRKA